MIEICLFIKNGNWYKQKQALLLNIQTFFKQRLNYTKANH